MHLTNITTATLSGCRQHGVKTESLPPGVVASNLLSNDAVGVWWRRVVGRPLVVAVVMVVVVAVVGLLPLRLLPLHVPQHIPFLLI